ncbi:hypothetical protein QP028_15630 [Corynebacterium suedekumii]|nr:hypothetical protein QP028_15630 [Corynebacterium suedekumii]
MRGPTTSGSPREEYCADSIADREWTSLTIAPLPGARTTTVSTSVANRTSCAMSRRSAVRSGVRSRTTKPTLPKSPDSACAAASRSPGSTSRAKSSPPSPPYATEILVDLLGEIGDVDAGGDHRGGSLSAGGVSTCTHRLYLSAVIRG